MRFYFYRHSLARCQNFGIKRAFISQTGFSDGSVFILRPPQTVVTEVEDVLCDDLIASG
jgi:hypothetical protein